MYYLGIGEDNGIIYGGTKRGLMHRLEPYPMVLPLRFKAFEGMKEYEGSDYAGRLFLEESFDPITRVRRGRVYCGGYVERTYVFPTGGTEGERSSIRLYKYQREPLHKLKGLHGSKLPIVFLGSDDFHSTWKIIDIEQDLDDTFVLILKSYRSLGEIPDIRWNLIPAVLEKIFRERIDNVENAVNRSAPNDVVDRCRDVLSLVFSHLGDAPTKDLGAAVKAYSKTSDGAGKELVLNAAEIVRRLHSRGKPNEAHKHRTRPLGEDDAQLAVRSLGLVLKEIGWAV